MLTAIVTALLVGALFHIQARSADWDPQYARDIVERTMRFGGSYYENSIHNKGPLEPGVYHFAALVSTYDSFWFAIAAIIIGVSLLVGAAARRVVQLFGGAAWLGWSVFAAVALHLTLSGADYAGVLYSRNMTVALLCGALLLLTGRMVQDGTIRQQQAIVIGAGVCLGLAAQTLLTTALSAGVLGLVGLDTLRRERLLLVSSAAVAFMSAPAWYIARGSWQPFWDGWWVYGRTMSSALGRSVPEQFGLGWDQFYAYSLKHLPAHLCVGGFLVLGLVEWRRLTPMQHRLLLALPAWWVAAWVEIILSQRYSSHYFVVTSVPLMLLCGAFATTMANATATAMRARKLSTRSHLGLPYVLVAFSMIWTGLGPLRSGLEAAGSFRGFGVMARDRELNRAAQDRAAQALLDLVSKPDDAMLTWTNEPWPFLNYRRVSATRFIWKSFLMGEVYLGPTSDEYVLPNSWEYWTADVRATHPKVFITQATVPVPEDTPAAQVLASDFEPVFDGHTMLVSLRDDAALSIRDRSGDERALMRRADGWRADGSTWRFVPPAASTDQPADGTDAADAELPALALGDLACRRFDAVVGFGDTLTFRFANNAGDATHTEFALAGGRVRTLDSDYPLTDFDAPFGESHSVSLVVGRTVAVFLVDGRMVGGMNLIDHTEVSLLANGPITLRDVGVGEAPTGGQC